MKDRVRLALLVIAVLICVGLWSYFAGEPTPPRDPRARLVQHEWCSNLRTHG